MSTSDGSILGLKLATDPRWADAAGMSLEEILSDHAFCEQKAATQRISLIQQYSERAELVEALAPVVAEEWGHFRMVWSELRRRGLRLQRLRKDDYVNLLLKQEPKNLPADERFLHKLLICAMIEARSCERFRLLSEQLPDEGLRRFYYKFMVSEAGHYRLFIDLANTYFPEEQVRAEWERWLEREAAVLQQLPARGDRMH